MSDEPQQGFGPVDLTALRRIRDVFDRHEPLVVDNELATIQPETLTITLSEGFTAPGRFDIRWSERGYYSFHYREHDGELEFRFDRHPNPHSPEKHFHPPPDASTENADSSCIEVELPELVALAVLQVWRGALDAGDVSMVNTVENPP